MNLERYTRITDTLNMRQPDLTVCMEGVHKSHNLAAVVRTADAIGVHEVHAVWKSEQMRLGGGTAMGSQNWVQLKSHQSIEGAITHLKSSGMQVLATNLSETAVDFREIDYTKPTAILLGQEKHGISPEALALADHDIVIPMVGMVQSLNVSVANATILYEAQRQRAAAGMYTGTWEGKIPREDRNRILFYGGYPKLATLANSKGLPIPDFGDEGQIIANEEWWHKMQTTQDNW